MLGVVPPCKRGNDRFHRTGSFIIYPSLPNHRRITRTRSPRAGCSFSGRGRAGWPVKAGRVSDVGLQGHNAGAAARAAARTACPFCGEVPTGAWCGDTGARGAPWASSWPACRAGLPRKARANLNGPGGTLGRCRGRRPQYQATMSASPAPHGRCDEPVTMSLSSLSPRRPFGACGSAAPAAQRGRPSWSRAPRSGAVGAGPSLKKLASLSNAKVAPASLRKGQPFRRLV